MTTTRTVKIADFLTKDQAAKAIALYEAHGHWDAVDEIRTQVIVPNLSTIDAKLGQRNDARYLAYAVVYALSQIHQDEGS